MILVLRPDAVRGGVITESRLTSARRLEMGPADDGASSVCRSLETLCETASSSFPAPITQIDVPTRLPKAAGTRTECENPSCSSGADPHRAPPPRPTGAAGDIDVKSPRCGDLTPRSWALSPGLRSGAPILRQRTVQKVARATRSEKRSGMGARVTGSVSAWRTST